MPTLHRLQPPPAEEEAEEEAGSGSDAEASGSDAEASGSEGGSDDEGGSDAGSGSGSEEEEESEEEIDQTIYAPPRTALLPAEVPVLEADEEHGLPGLAVPSATVGDLLAAYNALRAFSWQLRLSPFSFPDFAAAMASDQVRPVWPACCCSYVRPAWSAPLCIGTCCSCSQRLPGGGSSSGACSSLLRPQRPTALTRH